MRVNGNETLRDTMNFYTNFLNETRFHWGFILSLIKSSYEH